MDKQEEMVVAFLLGNLTYFELPKEIRKQLLETKVIKKNGELDKIGETLKKMLLGTSSLPENYCPVKNPIGLGQG